MAASLLTPFAPWQLLQVVAKATPRAGSPCVRSSRVATVQATVDAGCPASGEPAAGPFSLGNPTARQIALQRLRAPGCAEGNRMKPTKTATTNRAIVAPIQMVNRGSGAACPRSRVNGLAPDRLARPCSEDKEIARSGSRSSRRSGPPPAVSTLRTHSKRLAASAADRPRARM